MSLTLKTALVQHDIEEQIKEVNGTVKCFCFI